MLTKHVSSPLHSAADRSSSSITYVFISKDCFIHNADVFSLPLRHFRLQIGSRNTFLNRKRHQFSQFSHWHLWVRLAVSHIGQWLTANLTYYGAFPLHGTVRFGTARYGTVRLSSGRFAFPLQFSTAIEWAGLFIRRHNCAASTAVTSS